MHDTRINFPTEDASDRVFACGRQDGAAADGSRRVEPSPSREAGVVLPLLLLLAAGRRRGAEGERRGARRRACHLS